MDLAFVDREIDAVIGREIAEFLDDVAHLDDGRIHVHILLCQNRPPPVSEIMFSLSSRAGGRRPPPPRHAGRGR